MFSHLEDQQFTRLVSCVKQTNYTKGTAIVNQGDIGKEMFMIQSGMVYALVKDQKSNTVEENQESKSSKYSKRKRASIAYMESTVVDIYIPPPSFKLVPLSLPRSPLSKTPQTCHFFNVINILSLLHTHITLLSILLFSFNVNISFFLQVLLIL